MKMIKPTYAIAMELRKSDLKLEAEFSKLSNMSKWDWLRYATENTPIKSLEYARQLVELK